MYVILLAAMFFVAATLAGIFAPPFQKGEEGAQDPNTYLCCDTGDGKDCKPVPGTTTTFRNQSYALLKSNVYLRNINYAEHFDPYNGTAQINGQKVFLNVVPNKKGDLGPNSSHEPQCKVPEGNNAIQKYRDEVDWLYGKVQENDGENREYGCYEVPNDMLIYACRSDNPTGACDEKPNAGQVRWDVWVRLKDIDGGELQGKYKFLSECYKPEANEDEKGEAAIVFRPSSGGQPNLQLRTFKFIQPQKPAIWVSPYCKPAIYLYPEQKSEINVSVYPQGEMLLTIPEYPANGWNVVAEPNGNIHYQNSVFDYLYYEAAIPDQLVTKPKQGYVMSYDERSLFLTNLVTKLGLNEKETKQFVEYWVPILPASPYYFVGIVSTETLHDISPVFITPKPKNLIRVTLYFQPLEKKETVTPPVILPVDRSGYTAVEWGGIFKQDKNHPFSCFM